MTRVAGLPDSSDQISLFDPVPNVDYGGNGIVLQMRETKVEPLVRSDHDGVAPTVMVGGVRTRVVAEVPDSIPDLDHFSVEGRVEWNVVDGIVRRVAGVPHVEVVGVLLYAVMRVMTIITLNAVDSESLCERQERQRVGVERWSDRERAHSEEGPHQEDQELQSEDSHFVTLACVSLIELEISKSTASTISSLK